MKHLTLASTLLLAACGGSAADDQVATPDAAPGAADAAPLADAAIGGDPVGSWALRRVLSTTADAPVVGATTTTTITLSRFDVAADGAGFAITDDVCDVQLESSSGLVTPSLVPGYAASLATRTLAGTVDGGNLVVPLGIELSGAVLADPDADPLPTEAGDPAVRDDDDDGNPGITVQLQITGLGLVEVYVAQRNEATLRSDSLGDDRISGPLDTPRFEQATLGASNDFFAGDVTPVVNDADTRFTLVRVAAGTTCAEVLAQDEADLFGPR